MPLYEYECFVCSRRFERIQKVAADPVTACPSCGGSVRRLLGSPALQFKGSGWYVTDYAKSGSVPSGRNDGAAAPGAASKDAEPSSASEKKPAAGDAGTSSTAATSTPSPTNSST